jgi:predicted transcriptional regulator
MKTAVSIPDSTFQRAERFALRTSRSRSRLFADALEEYLDRHAGDAVTEAMNQTIDALDERPDLFVSATARRTLRSVDW